MNYIFIGKANFITLQNLLPLYHLSITNNSKFEDIDINIKILVSSNFCYTKKM